MKIESGKKIGPQKLAIIALTIIILLSVVLLFSGGGKDVSSEDQAKIECIEYVRRGCCDNPELDRCRPEETGWSMDEKPHTVCCE